MDMIMCLLPVLINPYPNDHLSRFGMHHAVKGLGPWRVIGYELGP